MLTRFVFGCTLLSLLLAEGLHAQARTVAVVYDDSGSMGHPQRPDAPWRHANYALQALTGLLTPQDALTVVLMSNPQQPVTIDLRRQVQELGTIRQGYSTIGQTPYAAVRQAMRVLEERSQQEAASGAAATEKWLVVLTDGEFQVEPADQRAFREDIREFVAATGAQVIFMLIGGIQPTVARVWEQEAQARLYEATDRDLIVAQMQQIAADITSRSPRPLDLQVRDGTVAFVSEFPLRRVTVLQQRRRPEELVALQEVQGPRGALRVGPALLPQMPPGSADGIVGRIYHAQGAQADTVIPAGRLTLRFDRAADARHLQVYPEVAARLAVWLLDAFGEPLSAGRGNVIEACIGEPVNVRATLLAPEGDTLLQRVQRTDLFDFRLHAGGRALPLRLDPQGTFFEDALPVADGTAPISVSAAYPGYFNFRSQVITLQGIDCRERELRLAPVPPWSARVTELREAPPLELRPTADGVLVTTAELQGWTIERIDQGRLRVDLERAEHGWLLRPRTAWGGACFTPTGRFPIELELRSPNPREAPLRQVVEVEVIDVGFWRKCGWLILTVLLLILLLVYLWGLLRKRRFCPGSEIKYQRLRGDIRQPGHTQKLAHGFVSRYLVPFVPERTAVDGVLFEASGRCGHVLIPPTAQTEGMYVAGELLEDVGRRPARLEQGDELEIRRGTRREIYQYHFYS